MMYNTFKKERYTIPTFNFGGSTRSSTGELASTGDPIYVIAGATAVYITVTGTRYGSTKLIQEQFYTTISDTGIVSSYNDWTKVMGMSLTDKYGRNMTTQSIDAAVYGVSTVAGSTTQVAYTSSGCKGTKTVAFAIDGQDLTFMTVSGNAYINTIVNRSGTTPVAPSSNNSFKYTDGMVGEERVRDYILFNSDTGGAVAQIKVWEG